jgi:hypothetical protein
MSVQPKHAAHNPIIGTAAYPAGFIGKPHVW